MPQTTKPTPGETAPPRPGRARNAERTKARILAAALRDFSARGINGARVDAIAARAETNKRMLYYYFGSKDGLFRAVLRHRLTEQTPAGAAHDRTGAGRIANLQDRMADSRDYVRLLMWEALERSDRGRDRERGPASGGVRRVGGGDRGRPACGDHPRRPRRPPAGALGARDGDLPVRLPAAHAAR